MTAAVTVSNWSGLAIAAAVSLPVLAAYVVAVIREARR